MLGTEVCATELRRRVCAGNRGVCNRAEVCWEQRCVQQSCGEGCVLGTEVCATELCMEKKFSMLTATFKRIFLH